MASIHAAFKWRDAFDRIVLLNAETTATLLNGPATHTLKLIQGVEGPVCGLIPIGGPVDSVDSSGLKWNLEGRRLEWGVLVSTSNEVAEDCGGVVTVETSQPLLWTCSIVSPT
jgi:thiamine pyrophosphokinase